MHPQRHQPFRVKVPAESQSPLCGLRDNTHCFVTSFVNLSRDIALFSIFFWGAYSESEDLQMRYLPVKSCTHSKRHLSLVFRSCCYSFKYRQVTHFPLSGSVSINDHKQASSTLKSKGQHLPCFNSWESCSQYRGATHLHAIRQHAAPDERQRACRIIIKS